MTSHAATAKGQAAPLARQDKVNSLGSATQKRHSLSFDERRDEILLMGLRLQEGVSALRFKAQTGRELYDSLPAENLQALENMNFLKKDGDYLRATPAGRLRLNAVLGKLLA